MHLGPGSYDPRMKTEKGNLMTVHESRFAKLPDENVPGPGTYTVSTVYSCEVHCCSHVQAYSVTLAGHLSPVSTTRFNGPS